MSSLEVPWMNTLIFTFYTAWELRNGMFGKLLLRIGRGVCVYGIEWGWCIRILMVGAGVDNA